MMMNRVDYLRVSLIDRCNFRCQYCMPQGSVQTPLAHSTVLTTTELLHLLQAVMIPVGFSRFRLTGGEPLLRPDVVAIVEAIAALPQVTDLSMTTNGVLLAKMARSLYEAGLRRINISLDSLVPDTFNTMIGYHNSTPTARWQQVWDGIQTAYAIGFNPLKLNVVVIPGVNDHEVLNLAALSIAREWHVRFIEFMPIGNGDWFRDKGWVDSATLRQQIHAHWGLEQGQVWGSGPADIFQIPGAKGTVGFISQMSECFCDRCNRMRLSADGWLRPCLLNETGQIDLRTMLREGASVAAMQEQVRQLLTLKPEINYKGRESGSIGSSYSRTMSQIGG
jgi:cyclic pyranopterin phosphate synthase